MVEDKSMKIFCIGLSKTATSSLAEALEILGYKAVHWDDTRYVFRYSKEGIDIDYKKFDTYDAFADTPIARIYRELDKKYPGSKFILTVRDVEKWIKSFEDQFSEGTEDPFAKRLHMDLYGTSSYDYDKCTTAFKSHTQNAIEYFKNRQQDLLIMDITKGDGWNKLCPFLNRPIPNISFPKRYTKEERKESVAIRIGRLLKNPSSVPGKIFNRLSMAIRTKK